MACSDAADRIFVFGGQVGMTQSEYSDELWSYDYNSNTWTKAGPQRGPGAVRKRGSTPSISDDPR
jgi:hypothetical protein